MTGASVSGPNTVSAPRALPKGAVAGLLVLWAAMMSLPGIDHGLWRPDEHRVAGICAEMARSGDFVTPRLNGEPFLEKPPLYFAAGALFGRVFGEANDVSYRLASLLFSALTLVLTFLLARRRHGTQAALLTVGILSSALMFFRTSRWIQVDMALVSGVTLAMYAYLRWLDEPRARYSMLLGAGIAVSFMVKGLVGPALIGAAVLADTVRLRKPQVLWRLRPSVILSVAAVPVCAWCGALYYEGGWGAVREVIVVNNFMRFAGIGKGAPLGHQHGIIEYIKKLPGDFLPWTFLLIPAVIQTLRNVRNEPYASWFIGPLVLLCMSSTKRDVYLLPLYPAAAAMVAGWLQHTERDRWGRAALAMTWACAGGLAAVPYAGIWLGHPVLGVLLGSFGVVCFCALLRRRELLGWDVPRGARLVLAVCTGLCCASALYFTYRTPRKDYLAFAEDAVRIADTEEIVIIHPDEILDGVLPMVSGRHYRTIGTPEEVREPGLYAWADSRARILTSLQATTEVGVLLVRETGSHRSAVLARVVANEQTRGGGLPARPRPNSLTIR